MTFTGLETLIFKGVVAFGLKSLKGIFVMIVFVNESYFAFKIIEPIVKSNSHCIQAFVLSTKTRNRLGPSFRIIRKCSPCYVNYRVLVDLITRLNGLIKKKSVSNLAKKYGIPILSISNVSEDENLKSLLPQDIGLTINFDQILKGKLLACFEDGVINFHASRLPFDRGISPVLWAFARGDNEIWGTLYSVDSGLDTGPIFEQFQLDIYKHETAFSLYERICTVGGRRLCRLIKDYNRGNLSPPSPQKEAPMEQSNLGWPDKRFEQMLKGTKRQLISWRDVLRTIF